MTPQTQASQIVQKHYKIIEQHLPIHSMTDSQMMKMAKEHATEEVKGIIKELKLSFIGVPLIEGLKMAEYVDDNINHWTSILDEIETE